MNEDISPDEKPFEATAQKLEDARLKGDFARSSDLNTALVYIGFLAGAFLVMQWVALPIGAAMVSLFDQAPEFAALLTDGGGAGLGGRLLALGLGATALMALVPAVFLIGGIAAGRGWVFAGEKLTPKLKRISPIANFGQKFGMDGLFGFVKSTIKLLLYTLILALVLWQQKDAILAALYGDAAHTLGLIAELLARFMAIVIVIALIFGAADFLWARHRHLRQMRMTREEMTDAMKRSEGDPTLKATRRQRGREIATNRMIADLPKADVVIVNPTHYAVALQWERNQGQVPVCLAKGVDETALRIREAAQAEGVPVFRDPPTARSLYAAVEIGQPILPDHYRAVAAAIRFSDQMRAKMREMKKRGWQ